MTKIAVEADVEKIVDLIKLIGSDLETTTPEALRQFVKPYDDDLFELFDLARSDEVCMCPCRNAGSKTLGSQIWNQLKEERTEKEAQAP